MDESGAGWFYRHVHRAAEFILNNPDKVRKGYDENALAIQNKFDKAWRAKVKQFQISIFSPTTKGAWVLRFDDILADALEQDNNAVFNLCCRLCSAYERKAFLDSLQYGAHLILICIKNKTLSNYDL